MVKLQNNKGKYFISVPKIKVEKLGLKAGTIFDVDTTSEGNLIFTKVKEPEEEK